MKQNNEKNIAERVVIKTPPMVSAEEWEAARQQLLVKEKALTRARDALAAERRRMPWLAVPKKYEFDGPDRKSTRLNSSHLVISYAVFCLKKKTTITPP